MSTNPKPGPAPRPAAPAVTTDDVAALTGAPTAAKVTPAKRRRIVVSQGAYEDLTRLRKVTDPGSGYTLRVGHDGTVAAYDRRTSKVADDVDVICPPVPAAPAQDEKA